MGPLNAYHGVSGETEVWRFLARAWEGIERWCCWPELSNLYVWTDKDRLGQKLVVGHMTVSGEYESECEFYRGCDVIDPSVSDLEMLSGIVRFWEVNGKRVAKGLDGRKGWTRLEKEKTVWTRSQQRWMEEEGFVWDEEWRVIKRKKIPGRVKTWCLDALNNALRVCYHSSKCRLCGELVGGRHFTGECKALEEIKKYEKKSHQELQREERWWVCWIMETSGKSVVEVVRRLRRYRNAI